MRMFRSFFSIIGLMIGHAAVAVIGFGIGVFKYMIEKVSPSAWRAANRVKPVAVRLIGKLKPVYRDSYRTDGQSLDQHWRTC